MNKAVFKLGQIVYLKTDPDQMSRIVTSYYMRKNSPIMYGLAMSDSPESFYQDFEITSVRLYGHAADN